MYPSAKSFGHLDRTLCRYPVPILLYTQYISSYYSHVIGSSQFGVNLIKCLH